MKVVNRIPFLPTIVVLIAILYLSLAEQPVDPDRIRLFEGADKVVHACMYMGLVWVGCFDLYRQSGRRVSGYWLLLALGTMVLGGAMEWLQGTITVARSADVIDFVANCSGAIVGLLLAWVFVPRVCLWLKGERS